MTIAAGILFYANGKYLFLQRPDGQWGLPAGSIEPGETPFQCAVRETFEEVGYVVAGNIELPIIFNDGTFICYFVKCEEFKVTLNHEHSQFAWLPLDLLPTPLFMDTKKIVALSFAMDRADSARVRDINGWFEVENNPISRAGVFDYLGRNIPGADPDKMYKVYRPAEELADPDCIASFRLLPWIDDHAMLGNAEGLTPIAQKPIGGVIGEKVYFDSTDGEGALKANIKMFAETHEAAINAGKVELSGGYRCKYQKLAGIFKGVPYDYVQRFIRGNHLASVDEARLGPDIAVMDGFQFTLDSKDFQMAKTTQGPAKIRANRVSALAAALIAFATDAADDMPDGEKPAGELAQATTLIEQVAPLLETLAALPCITGSADLASDPVDGVIAADADDKDDKKKPGDPVVAADAEDDLPSGAMDGAELRKYITAAVARGIAAQAKPVAAMDAREVLRDSREADKLAASLSNFVGVFDHSDMTRLEVAAYGAKKLGLKPAAGHEIAAVEAYLHNRPVPSAEQVAHAADGKDAPSGNLFTAQYAEKE